MIAGYVHDEHGVVCNTLLNLDLIPTDAPDPREATDFKTVCERLDFLLWQLPDRDRLVVKLRFGLHDGKVWTLKNCGKEVRVGQERARQMILSMIRKFNFECWESTMEELR